MQVLGLVLMTGLFVVSVIACVLYLRHRTRVHERRWTARHLSSTRLPQSDPRPPARTRKAQGTESPGTELSLDADLYQPLGESEEPEHTVPFRRAT